MSATYFRITQNLNLTVTIHEISAGLALNLPDSRTGLTTPQLDNII